MTTPTVPPPAPEKCLYCGNDCSYKFSGGSICIPCVTIGRSIPISAPIPAEQEKCTICWFGKDAAIHQHHAFAPSPAPTVQRETQPPCSFCGAALTDLKSFVDHKCPSPAPQRETLKPESTPHHHRCYVCSAETGSLTGEGQVACSDYACGIDPAEHYAGRLCPNHVGNKQAAVDAVMPGSTTGRLPSSPTPQRCDEQRPQRGTEEGWRLHYKPGTDIGHIDLHKNGPCPCGNNGWECIAVVPAAQLATMRQQNSQLHECLDEDAATIARLRESVGIWQREADNEFKLGCEKERKVRYQLSTATSRLQRFEQLRLKTYILMSSAHARLLMYKCKDSGYVMDSLRDWKATEEAFLAAPAPDVLDKKGDR